MNSVVTSPRPGLRRQTWSFTRHFFEMCIAMCVGAGLSGLLLRGAALVGYPDLRQQSPGLTLLVVVVVITLPMAAWMRFRGMEWRPILEMSVAGIGVVVGVTWLGIVSASTVEIGSVCGLACVVMFVVMLFRLDLYTGRTGHHMGHAQHEAR